MRILMVSSFLPFPLHSGGHVRLYNILKQLSKMHEITLICEKRPSQSESDIKELEKICKKITVVNRRKQWTINNVIKSGISSKSFLTSGHTHTEMKQVIKLELEENIFDIIHIETFYVMQNLPDTSLPIVLAEHNIEYQVYKRFVENSPLALRPLLNLDINKIKKEEENSWKKVAKLIAVSKDDCEVMRKAGLNPTVISNGVDINKFCMKSESSSGVKKILFIGDFKWIQNRDAVKFIIEEIWPEIELRIKKQELRTEVKLWIVGRSIPLAIRNLTTASSIIFDEESSIKPTEQIFQDADMLLAPLRVGGGTSYKILESMSCGTPVVTMQMSADSIEATSNRDIMTGKTASELAEKTLELLGDKEQYNKLAINGRKLIEQKYTWEMIAKHLEQVYKDCLKLSS